MRHAAAESALCQFVDIIEFADRGNGVTSEIGINRQRLNSDTFFSFILPPILPMLTFEYDALQVEGEF